MTYYFSEDVKALNREALAKLGLNLVQGGKPSKYHNAPAEAAGMTFQSGHEAAGVAGLILAEKQGEIFGLRLQVRFPLPGHNEYRADAVYVANESVGRWGKMLTVHVVDFKGYKTEAYRIKKKLFVETYGQDIEEL